MWHPQERWGIAFASRLEEKTQDGSLTLNRAILFWHSSVSFWPSSWSWKWCYTRSQLTESKHGIHNQRCSLVQSIRPYWKLFVSLWWRCFSLCLSPLGDSLAQQKSAKENVFLMLFRLLEAKMSQSCNPNGQKTMNWCSSAIAAGGGISTSRLLLARWKRCSARMQNLGSLPGCLAHEATPSFQMAGKSLKQGDDNHSGLRFAIFVAIQRLHEWQACI